MSRFPALYYRTVKRPLARLHVILSLNRWQEENRQGMTITANHGTQKTKFHGWGGGPVICLLFLFSFKHIIIINPESM